MASAKTLRELAQTSNLLLVLSDRLVSESDHEVKKRTCGLSHKQISERSQKLKALIDKKIESLTANDYRILVARENSCQQECTCDIYALAFERKGEVNQVLEQKASQMTLQGRERCVARVRDICLWVSRI